VGSGLVGLDQIVDVEDKSLRVSDHVLDGDFEARLYVLDNAPQTVGWAPFVRSGFADAAIGRAFGPSALLIIRLLREVPDSPTDQVFAFAFGSAGRFLLKPDCYRRGFGLRAALNLIYPTDADTASRLRAIDIKRRAATTTRARVQASEQTDFEAFDVNRSRDILSKTAGTPYDNEGWGGRVTGGDSLSFTIDRPFDELGELCRRIETTHLQTDYQDQFDWIDQIQPINDPTLVQQLREHVSELLRSRTVDRLSLAPPEVVDWDLVTSFRYSFDRAQGRARGVVTHPDIRLADYLSGMARTRKLDDLTYERMHAGRIFAMNGDSGIVHSWPAWKCLVGELLINGITYILDEGDFYEVRQDYLAALDSAIAAIPLAQVDLPTSTPNEHEGPYNIRAASVDPELLLLDKKTVKINTKTTLIEICDLLTSKRQLIHVKRHLGSSDLSHLFAQGVVSACLLQESPEFRKKAIDKIAAVSNHSTKFGFLNPDSFTTSDFEVVYAIAESWNSRTFEQGLPFFSKINLREAVQNLHGRGFSVSLHQIHC
jgi:uncharacterized protein (TIGR04141 family)